MHILEACECCEIANGGLGARVCSFPGEMAPCFHPIVIKGYWIPKSYPTITPE